MYVLKHFGQYAAYVYSAEGVSISIMGGRFMPLLFCYAGLMPPFCRAGLNQAAILLCGAHHAAIVLLCGAHGSILFVQWGSSAILLCILLCEAHAATLFVLRSSCRHYFALRCSRRYYSALRGFLLFIATLLCVAHRPFLPRGAHTAILLCGAHAASLLCCGDHAVILRCGAHAAT